jgi:O-antigen/teichoic acid export membrane protein
MKLWHLIQLETLWQKLQHPDLIATLIRGASAALLIQTAGAGINYGMQIGLARWMGAAEYGTYDYVMTLSTVLALLAGLGLSGAVLRFVPEYTVKQDWSRLRGLLLTSWWQTAIAGLITAAIAIVIIEVIDRSTSLNSLRLSLLLGVWLIPLLALLKLQLEMSRSIRQIVLAYFPSLVMFPLLLTGTAFGWVYTQQSLTSITAIVISGFILVFILIGQQWFFQRALLPSIRSSPPSFGLKQWLLVSLPLLFIDGSFIVLNQTDTLMIGALLGTKAVGIYGAAFKTATWVSFILASINAIAAPIFSTLYAQGDRHTLQQLVSIIARWMFYPAFIVTISLFVFSDPLLSLFGSEFVVAKWSLLALSLGQLVNVGAGSVGYLLMMTGHQNQCAFVFACSALINVSLNLIGIPILGTFGAAVATALSMILWNVWLNRLVVKYLGINPSIVAALRPNLAP